MPSQDRLYSGSFLWASHTNALSRVEFSLLYLMCTLVQYVGGDLRGLYSSGSDRGPPQGASGIAETQAPTELSMLACVSSSVFCSFYHYTTTEGTFETILVKNRLGYQDLDLHQPETGHF